MGALRALRHSSNACNTVKKEGTNSTARQVDAMMPLSTLSPSDFCPLVPARDPPEPLRNSGIRYHEAE